MSIATILFLIFNLIFVPVVYPDQKFDGVDNVLRGVAGFNEADSRAVVGALYDAFPLTP